MTITLDDVALLLHLPIVGAFHSFELLHIDDTVEMLVELLEVSAVETRVETIQCHGSYARRVSDEDRGMSLDCSSVSVFVASAWMHSLC